MATSNVQFQQIQQQLINLGYQPNQGILMKQINDLTAQIATIDKTNVYLYSVTLDRLYSLQSRMPMSNSAQIQSLLTQKIQLLENLTS
jgi:hypothetical protein